MSGEGKGNGNLSDYPYLPSVQAHGASVVQVELGLGRNAAVIFWISAFVSAAAVVGLLIAVFAYRGMVAHVNVLQYDLAAVKAQLIERGLYEPTAH